MKWKNLTTERVTPSCPGFWWSLNNVSDATWERKTLSSTRNGVVVQSSRSLSARSSLFSRAPLPRTSFGACFCGCAPLRRSVLRPLHASGMWPPAARLLLVPARGTRSRWIFRHNAFFFSSLGLRRQNISGTVRQCMAAQVFPIGLVPHRKLIVG
jgi:hypothetical protein